MPKYGQTVSHVMPPTQVWPQGGNPLTYTVLLHPVLSVAGCITPEFISQPITDNWIPLTNLTKQHGKRGPWVRSNRVECRVKTTNCYVLSAIVWLNHKCCAFITRAHWTAPCRGHVVRTSDQSARRTPTLRTNHSEGGDHAWVTPLFIPYWTRAVAQFFPLSHQAREVTWELRWQQSRSRAAHVQITMQTTAVLIQSLI